MIQDLNKIEIIKDVFNYLKENNDIILIGTMAYNIYKKKYLLNEKPSLI
jgi:hypothetical protein